MRSIMKIRKIFCIFSAVDDRGKGKLYSSYFDCVKKVYKTEGPLGFYKGLGPNYVRLGPHTMLCLVFWDELNALYKKYMYQKSQLVE